MTFTVEAGHLASILTPVALVATTGKRGRSDIAKLSIRPQPERQMLIAEANNGHVCIQTDINVKFDDSSLPMITLPCTELMNMLRSLNPREQVELRISSSEAGHAPSLEMRQSSGSTLTLPGEGQGVYPALPKPRRANRIVIPVRELLRAARVGRATGKDMYQPQYQRWVLRVTPQGYRAAAGDGGRFLVFDRQGHEVISADTSFDLYIHRDHTPLLLRLLNMSDGTDLRLTDWESDGAMITRLELGGCLIHLLGHERCTWPDENLFLARNSKLRVASRLADWRGPVRAALATYTQKMKQEHWIHITSLLIDTERRIVTITAGAEVSVVQTVPLLDAEVEDGAPHSLTFSCATTFLDEMVRPGHLGEFIQMEFIDEKTPVVIRYTSDGRITDDHWHRDADAVTRERDTMFFAAKDKKGSATTSTTSTSKQ